MMRYVRPSWRAQASQSAADAPNPCMSIGAGWVGSPSVAVTVGFEPTIRFHV